MALFKRKFQAPTAYSFTKIERVYPDGSVLLRLWQWDCWGIVYLEDGRTVRTILKEDEKVGYHNFITLEMVKKGCCPPLLKEGFLGTGEDPD